MGYADRILVTRPLQHTVRLNTPSEHTQVECSLSGLELPAATTQRRLAERSGKVGNLLAVWSSGTWLTVMNGCGSSIIG